MNVCHLIFQSTFPSEEKGKYKFSDFTKDEKKMNQLFEAFIRNFIVLSRENLTLLKRNN